MSSMEQDVSIPYILGDPIILLTDCKRLRHISILGLLQMFSLLELLLPGITRLNSLHYLPFIQILPMFRPSSLSNTEMPCHFFLTQPWLTPKMLICYCYIEIYHLFSNSKKYPFNKYSVAPKFNMV